MNSPPSREQRHHLVRMPGQDLARRTTPARGRSRSSRSRGGRQPGWRRPRAARRARSPVDRPPPPRPGPPRWPAPRTTRRAGSGAGPGQARASPGAPWRRPRARPRATWTRRASSAAASSSWLARSARRASELDVELDRRVAHRLGEGGQLREAVEPLARPAEDGVRVVAGREQEPPVGRRRDDLQRLLHEAERLLGGVGGQRGDRRVDREVARAGGVARGQRVLGEHRQPGGGRVAAVQEQVDHGGVDLPAASHREQARGELAHLLVGERVVRGLALGLLEQEAGGDRGRELVGELRRRRRPAGRGSPGGPGG